MSLAAEAVAAFHRGWPLTPLNGKVPILAAWTTQPKPDLGTLLQWATSHNLGLRTGEVSGVDVADFDGETTPEQLGLPRSPTVRTGSGKLHVYLKHHPGVRNSASKLAPRVDVRGDGGQVVYVGSIHPDTRQSYTWVITPEQAPLADWPKHLLERILPPPEPKATNGSAWARKALEREAESVRAAPEGMRNTTLNTAAFNLGQIVAGQGLADAEVEAVLLQAATASGLPESESRATIRSGMRGGAKAPRQRPAPRANPAVVAKDEILIPGTHILPGGEVRDVSVVDFSNALISALPEGVLYRRAGLPGELVGEPIAFRLLLPDRTRLLIDQNTRLARKTIKDDEPVSTFIPAGRDHANLVIASAVDHVEVRTLDHLVSHPVYDTTWRLSPPGHCNVTYYDEPLALRGLTPIRNTEEIRGVLEDLVYDFPFASSSDRDCYLGLLLTPLIRPAIVGNVPMHVITSPIERTGKTKLASEVLGGVYLGAPVPAMQITGSEDERDKRLLGLLLSGTRLVHFDNLDDMIDSPVLASLLTTATYKGRVLGRTEIVDVPNSVVVVATGNNLRATGEIAKRTVPIQLRPDTEHPEARHNFRHPDIAAYAVQQRRHVLECMVGMVQNWLDAGQPVGAMPMGGFDRWAAVVGGILAQAGFDGWLQNAAEWRASVDDFAGDLATLVDAWSRRDSIQSAKELFAMARELDVFPWTRTKPTEQGQLTSFSMSVLRRATNRVVGQFRIETRASGNNRTYRLVEIKGPEVPPRSRDISP